MKNIIHDSTIKIIDKDAPIINKSAPIVICPECESPYIIRQGRCWTCMDCGLSKCS